MPHIPDHLDTRFSTTRPLLTTLTTGRQNRIHPTPVTIPPAPPGLVPFILCYLVTCHSMIPVMVSLIASLSKAICVCFSIMTSSESPGSQIRHPSSVPKFNMWSTNARSSIVFFSGNRSPGTFYVLPVGGKLQSCCLHATLLPSP